MSIRTVDWTGWRGPQGEEPEAEGLRERKKRLMRQQLSDTATEMFMERGFDAVRVSEIAEACGVSEKTVFNYFPTKEALILDRWDSTADALRRYLADPALSPVEAALQILDDELGGMTSWLAAQDDPARATAMIMRFGHLVRSTPSLRAHQHDRTEQLVSVAAQALAQRAGTSPEDPEPQIAATALLGLWRVQFQALRKHLDGTRPPARIHDAVSTEVRRAAGLLTTGLSSLASPAGDPAD
ncbi:TetR family transcriptional regulator [Streptacidiphilus sp. EB129]|uniref:TetR family transcriptional regulator n=1 Tax=Streptacidiphilus sp. EB129 TaxID=3156262 RepID=UPI003517A30F